MQDTTLILQQNRNTTLNIKRWAAQSQSKPIDTPKLTIGHFIALQKEEIQLHAPEHRHKFLQPGNFGNVCSVCYFLWCKYPRSGQLQAANLQN